MNDEEGNTMTETTNTPRVRRNFLAFLREGRGGASSTAVAALGAKKHAWSPRRTVALVMMLLFPLIGVFGATSAANAEDEAMKYAFYKVASSTTAFFSTVQDPSNAGGDGNDFKGDWPQFMSDPGSAGSLLGYADPNFSDTGWLASKLSGSSDAIGYETLIVRNDEGNASDSELRGMVDYAHFGASLKGMGLDATSTGLSLGFMNVMAGGLIMILYILGGAVDGIFSSFVDLLATLNPFKLFYLGVEMISPEFAEGMVGGNAEVGALGGVAKFIGGWYQLLNSLSWTVMVPLFLGLLLFSLFMFKKMDRGGAVKKFVIRLVFIGLGLPLLGSMYTGMLNSMGDMDATGSSGSTRVVMSTYVDFESWAVKSRLAIPEGATIAWDDRNAQPTGAAQANVRNTALAINNQSLSLGLTPIVSATDSFDATWSKHIMDGRATDADTPTSSYSKTVGMLWRFMNNSQLSSASYETAMKGALTQSKYYEDNIGAEGAVAQWFESLQKDPKGMNELNGPVGSDNLSPVLNPLIAVEAGQGLRGSDVAGGRQFTSKVSCPAAWALRIADNDEEGSPRNCNLSPLAMYNYLNTDFNPTSMTMYSSSNVQSEATRSIHNSVNQVGTGMMGFLYWFNAVALLGSFVLIGLGFAFSMLFSSIRRSFQIITAVPFATLGALAAIAKVVVYTMALILEVLVTIFVYQFVQMFLTSLPQLIEMPFAQMLNNGDAGIAAGFITFLSGGWAFRAIVTLLSIAGILLFTVMALRLRKTLVKAVEEAVTKLVEKFMEAQVGMPRGGGVAPALAGGLAAGAGAAAANRMMSGGKKGAVGNALPGGTGNGGAPAAVETASGTSQAGTDVAVADGNDGAPPAGSGADGNGDPGSPLAITASNGANGTSGADGAAGGSVSEEVAMGKEIEAKGLSKPEETPAPKVGGDDPMSAASNSADTSAEGYKAADAQKLVAGKEGVEAVGHGATAVAKGSGGDAAGAAEAGGRAVEHGGAAVAAGHQAKQKEADAGRSSLDKPDQRHAKAAAQAERVSRAGGTVANAASTANATSAGKGAATKAPAKTVKGSSTTTGSPTTKSSAAKPVQGQGAKAAPGTKPSTAPSSRPVKAQAQSRPAGTASGAKPNATPASRPVKTPATAKPAKSVSAPQAPQSAPHTPAKTVRAPQVPKVTKSSPKPAEKPTPKRMAKPIRSGSQNRNGADSDR